MKNSEAHVMNAKESILHYARERLTTKRIQDIQENRQFLSS